MGLIVYSHCMGMQSGIGQGLGTGSMGAEMFTLVQDRPGAEPIVSYCEALTLNPTQPTSCNKGIAVAIVPCEHAFK